MECIKNIDIKILIELRNKLQILYNSDNKEEITLVEIEWKRRENVMTSIWDIFIHFIYIFLKIYNNSDNQDNEIYFLINSELYLLLLLLLENENQYQPIIINTILSTIGSSVSGYPNILRNDIKVINRSYIWLDEYNEYKKSNKIRIYDDNKKISCIAHFIQYIKEYLLQILKISKCNLIDTETGIQIITTVSNLLKYNCLYEVIKDECSVHTTIRLSCTIIMEILYYWKVDGSNIATEKPWQYTNIILKELFDHITFRNIPTIRSQNSIPNYIIQARQSILHFTEYIIYNNRDTICHKIVYDTINELNDIIIEDNQRQCCLYHINTLLQQHLFINVWEKIELRRHILSALLVQTNRYTNIQWLYFGWLQYHLSDNSCSSIRVQCIDISCTILQQDNTIVSSIPNVVYDISIQILQYGLNDQLSSIQSRSLYSLAILLQQYNEKKCNWYNDKILSTIHVSLPIICRQKLQEIYPNVRRNSIKLLSQCLLQSSIISWEYVIIISRSIYDISLQVRKQVLESLTSLLVLFDTVDGNNDDHGINITTPYWGIINSKKMKWYLYRIWFYTLIWSVIQEVEPSVIEQIINLSIKYIIQPLCKYFKVTYNINDNNNNSVITIPPYTKHLVNILETILQDNRTLNGIYMQFNLLLKSELKNDIYLLIDILNKNLLHYKPLIYTTISIIIPASYQYFPIPVLQDILHNALEDEQEYLPNILLCIKNLLLKIGLNKINTTMWTYTNELLKKKLIIIILSNTSIELSIQTISYIAYINILQINQLKCINDYNQILEQILYQINNLHATDKKIPILYTILVEYILIGKDLCNEFLQKSIIDNILYHLSQTNEYQNIRQWPLLCLSSLCMINSAIIQEYISILNQELMGTLDISTIKLKDEVLQLDDDDDDQIHNRLSAQSEVKGFVNNNLLCNNNNNSKSLMYEKQHTSFSIRNTILICFFDLYRQYPSTINLYQIYMLLRLRDRNTLCRRTCQYLCYHLLEERYIKQQSIIFYSLICVAVVDRSQDIRLESTKIIFRQLDTLQRSNSRDTIRQLPTYIYIFTHILLFQNNLWDIALIQKTSNIINDDININDKESINLWNNYFSLSGKNLRSIRHSIIEFLYNYCFIHPIQRISIIQKILILLYDLISKYDTTTVLAKKDDISFCIEDCIFLIWLHLLQINSSNKLIYQVNDKNNYLDSDQDENLASTHQSIVQNMYRKNLIQNIIPSIIQIYQLVQKHFYNHSIHLCILLLLHNIINLFPDDIKNILGFNYILQKELLQDLKDFREALDSGSQVYSGS